MRVIRSAVIYTALALAANTALADPADIAALRDGSMKKLVVHETPETVGDISAETLDGGEISLADHKGQIVLLNFWATWCAPCRKEMPALDRLQQEMGGADFNVLTISSGPNNPVAIRKFFEETGVTSLPVLLDPQTRISREMAVLGLPVTMILDRDGNEIARLHGDAEWDSDSAKAIIAALMAED